MTEEIKPKSVDSEKNPLQEEKNNIISPEQQIPPQGLAVQAEADEDDRNFFEKEIGIYRGFLARSWDSAYKRYGLTLFHSLSAEEKVKFMQELGFEPIDARDFYNKAVLSIQNNDLKKAEQFLQKALEIDPEHPESIFNMALLLEKTDRKVQALEYWGKYLDVISDEEEIRVISDHLEQVIE